MTDRTRDWLTRPRPQAEPFEVPLIASYNRNQPRDPGGEGGGQWIDTSPGGDGGRGNLTKGIPAGRAFEVGDEVEVATHFTDTHGERHIAGQKAGRIVHVDQRSGEDVATVDAGEPGRPYQYQVRPASRYLKKAERGGENDLEGELEKAERQATNMRLSSDLRKRAHQRAERIRRQIKRAQP